MLEERAEQGLLNSDLVQRVGQGVAEVVDVVGNEVGQVGVLGAAVATTSSDTCELSDNGKRTASNVFRPRLGHALGDALILGSALVRFAHPSPF